jgi:DNA modification methylase
VACSRTGRNYIGFELDERYHAIALQRIADTVDEMLEAADA